jgi:hypothetical protein
MLTKLRVLVAVHLVLTASQLAIIYQMLQVTSIWMMPLIWGAHSVIVGQAILLAFWAGLGTSGRARRIAGTVAGIVYLALWSSSPILISLWIVPKVSWWDWLRQFAIQLGQHGVFVLILSAVVLVMRRWFAKLDCMADPIELSEKPRFQFSIQHLLVITTMTALFLASRRDKIEGLDLRLMIITTVLMIGVFLVNALYAVRMTLRRGPIGRRLFLVFVVAALLGIGLSLISGLSQVSWWLAASFALAMTVPTLVIVLSLLVVRACGYRLVPIPPARTPGILTGIASPM